MTRSTRKPQDHKLSANHPVRQALDLQGANVAQKAMLDNVVTKMILVLKELEHARAGRDGEKSMHLLPKAALVERLGVTEAALDKIKEYMGLDRHQTAELRSSPGFEYPEPEIQAVLTRAANELTELLLNPPQKSDAQ